MLGSSWAGLGPGSSLKMLRILAAASATLLSVASAQECTNVDEFTVRRRFSPPYGLADAGSARLPTTGRPHKRAGSSAQLAALTGCASARSWTSCTM